MFYNSIGLRFAFQKFESVGVFLCIWFSKVGCFIFCSVFVFVERTSHPSLVSSLSLVSLPSLVSFLRF